MLRALALGLIVSLAPVASGEMVISEWMYNGSGTGNTGEFIEFTNIGYAAVDMTGWSFDDDSRIAGTVSLSAFGVVAPGQSVILTDETAATFAAIWGLSGVTIIGGSTTNLGRNDEINLFDASGILVDRLTYGDENYPGTVRTQTKSCNVPVTDYGYTVVQTTWVLAAEYDSFGSKVSTRGEVGSPGRIVGYARSDFDQDGDVDVDDLGVFICCMAGPSISYDTLPSGCTLTPDADGFIAADCDEDGDVDMADFGGFQLCYSGEGNPADASCGSCSGESGVTQIVLNGSSISVTGTGVMVNGTRATITSDGTYNISGTLTDGQIVVNTPDPGLVELIFNGVNISSSTNAPIYVISAASTKIVLADQTVSYLSDASTYVPVADEPNAALFSDDPLLISGTGSLTVHGHFNDAITSKDGLVIESGTINVTSVDDGIRGKDFLVIHDGNITVTSTGDGLKADNAEDTTLGYISIEDGTFHITSGGDAIAAETNVSITGGEFTLVSGGGHTATIPESLSAKGIKGVVSVAIGGGTVNIDAADDGVHSNSAVTISGGTLTIATKDDGIHADSTIHIITGTITITTCFEGIESTNITIDNGIIHIISSDDAITANTTVSIADGNFVIVSGGGHTVTIPADASAKAIKGLVSVVIGGGTFSIDSADDGVHSNNTVTISGGTLTIAVNSGTSPSASYGDGIHADTALNITGGTMTITPCYEGIESPHMTINNGTIHITSTDDGINGAGGTGSNNWLHINGGYIVVNAQGDGIDVNGSITMTNGTVLVHGPTGDMNAAIDYDTTFNISGGFLVAAGSAGMAQAPSTTSTQRSVKITYSSTKSAGYLAHIQRTTGGTNIVTFAPAKQYRSLVVSTPLFTSGLSCGLFRGGSCTGTVTDGLYQGGTYSGGTGPTTFTTTSIVTNVSAP
jgi:hypothetical protein